jgi:archaellum biogenesis ATPase FlaH|tara:strand:+ start:164 stop:448 length:285 start_codon:yes stop_codon:yes gene_type:complete
MTGDILNFIQSVGVPITVALATGAFLFLILKFILAQVKDQVDSISGSLLSLENKCDVMNNDIVKIDCLFSSAFNVEPNLERVAASEGKEDCRDD